MAEKLTRIMIQDTIDKIAQSSNEKEFNENIKDFIKEIEMWQKTNIALNKDLMDIANTYKSIKEDENGKKFIKSSKQMTRIRNKFLAQRDNQSKMKTLDDITEHLKNGYYLLMKFRNLIATPILYKIAFIDESDYDKTNQNIMVKEITLTEEQIIDLLTLGTESFSSGITSITELSNKFKLTLRNNKIRSLANQDEYQEKVSNLGFSRLFNSLKTALNKSYGWTYEVYYVLKDYLENSTTNFNNYTYHKGVRFEDLLKEIEWKQDSIEGWKKGDYVDENQQNYQLKAIFNSAASVITNLSLNTTINQLKQALKQKGKDRIEELQKIFTVNDIELLEQKIERQANENAKIAIEDFFKKRSLT